MEQTQVNDQTEVVNDKSDNEQVVNPEGVLAKNRELLAAQKKLKDELDQVRSQITLQEQDKLAAQGKKDELIESLRKSLRDEQEGRKAERNTYAYSVISARVKEEAAKQGCVNGDAFIKLLEKDDFNSLEIGDNYNVNSEDLKRLIEAKKNNLNFLFRKTVPPTSDLPPNYVDDLNDKPKDFSNMSVKELENMIVQMDAQEKGLK